jgi:hypothetical protein
MSHSGSSRGLSRVTTIPFAWENKPGVSKVTYEDHQNPNTEGDDFVLKLPLPPCPTEKAAKLSALDLHIPLPPCAFQPPLRSSSARGLRKHEDPFLAAYKECTKTKSTAKGKGQSFRNHVRSIFRKNMLVFSCKRSCSVRDDDLVRVSQLPYDRDEDYEEREN